MAIVQWKSIESRFQENNKMWKLPSELTVAAVTPNELNSSLEESIKMYFSQFSRHLSARIALLCNIYEIMYTFRIVRRFWVKIFMGFFSLSGIHMHLP